LSPGVLSWRIQMTLVKFLYSIKFMYWRVFLNRAPDWNGVVSLYISGSIEHLRSYMELFYLDLSSEHNKYYSDIIKPRQSATFVFITGQLSKKINTSHICDLLISTRNIDVLWCLKIVSINVTAWKNGSTFLPEVRRVEDFEHKI
jgi:hypothetical protein